MIESLKQRQPWKPEPWTRDYEGEARRGANVARTRERRKEAEELIGLLGFDTLKSEGAEMFAAECLALLAEKALDELATTANARVPTPAAGYAKKVRAELVKRLAAEASRDTKRRQRGANRADEESFSAWVVSTIKSVESQRKRGIIKILDVRLPRWPFGIRGVKEFRGQDVKICWRNCLLRIIEKAYADERAGPPGAKTPWRNRQRHVKQIIERTWERIGEAGSAAHRRWNERGQTGDY